MSAQRYALLAAFAFLVMFVSANLLANSWLRSWRLDLTENGLFTLSEGAERTLDELSEPIELTLYYSRGAASSFPQVQAYGARVREMLQTFAARSRGRVRFVEIDVEPLSEQEDAAAAAGLEPLRLYEGADPLYLGLTGANAIDDRSAIAFFSPEREAFLEYEITRLIYELENPERTRVGLITGLPWNAGGFGAPPPQVVNELERLFDLTTLPADFTEIPDVDVLAIIHPPPLSDVQAYAIDQFILRKGRAFVALDPASLLAEQSGASASPFGPQPIAPAPTASTLEPLLSTWGVAMTREVVLDRAGALPVRAVDANGQPIEAVQPLIFAVPAAQYDREDLMTAWLNREMNFGLAGALSWSEREGIEALPLVETSAETMRMNAAEAMLRPSPADVMRNWLPSGGRIETVALRLTGHLRTAFPDGPPAGAPPPAEGDQRLTDSATPAHLVIVSDADFLADEFYLGPQGVAQGDNASFALNAIDVLGGSDALVSLRSRAPSTRRMELVEDLERQAQQRIEERQGELQSELQRTEAQLAELQARGRGSGFFTGDLGAELTGEEQAAIERFQSEVGRLRTERRNVERDLRREIDRLKAGVVFVNMWLAPLLVAGAGLFLFWRRQRRAKAGERA